MWVCVYALSPETHLNESLFRGKGANGTENGLT